MPNMGDIGFSFAPGATRDINRDGTTRGTSRSGALSTPSVARLISLRVPDRPSPTAIAPMPLLQSQGGAGLQGLAGLSLPAGFQPALQEVMGALLGRMPRRLFPGQEDQGLSPFSGLVTTQPRPPRITPAGDSDLPGSNGRVEVPIETAPDATDQGAQSLFDDGPPSRQRPWNNMDMQSLI